MRSVERLKERSEERAEKRRRMAGGNQEDIARGGVEAEDTTLNDDNGNILGGNGNRLGGNSDRLGGNGDR